MPISAEPSRQGGFTLLEIMCAVALVGLTVLPLLEVREQCYARAYRASRMQAAMNHAEQLVVKCLLTADEYDQYEAPVEDDPQFRYVLSLEEFDVSTGLTAKEAENQQEQDGTDTGAASFGSSLPGDAGFAEEEQEDRDDPHVVRRFHVTVLWPAWTGEDDDAWDQVELEGFLPMVWEREQESNGESSG